MSPEDRNGFNPRLVISHEAMREAAEGEEGDKVSIRAS